MSSVRCSCSTHGGKRCNFFLTDASKNPQLTCVSCCGQHFSQSNTCSVDKLSVELEYIRARKFNWHPHPVSYKRRYCRIEGGSTPAILDPPSGTNSLLVVRDLSVSLADIYHTAREIEVMEVFEMFFLHDFWQVAVQKIRELDHTREHY